MASVDIDINGKTTSFDLDFAGKRRRWSSDSKVPESYFPLVAEYEGRRFELYSDGTFSEVER
jgi:hypothetical protein